MDFRNLITVISIVAVSSTWFVVNEINAQENGDDRTDMSEVEDKNYDRNTWFPIISYSDETSLLLGVGTMLALNHLDTNTNDKKKTRFDNVTAIAAASTNKNVILSLTPEFYFDNEHYNLKMKLAYSKIPDRFFGTGENLSKDHEGEKFETENTIFQSTIMVKVFHDFRIGLGYQWHDYSVTEIVTGGLLDQNQFIGQEGGTISGAGIIIDHDNRDNTFSASTGGYYQISATRFTKDIGSDFEFTQYNIDLRHYFSVTAKSVLAFQAVAQSNEGDVPFNRLATLGGSKIMRGIYQGRFRDKNRMVFQSEYRYSFNPRWSVTTFANIGQVAATRNELDGSNLKRSIGGGVGYALDPKNKLHLHLSIGFSETGSATSLTLGEAF